MTLYALDHVQLAMPTGEEDRARAFYADVLGLTEVPKPAHLAARGGVWFEAGTIKLHLGVEQDFRPARKAHPALRARDLASLIECCERAGYTTTEDQPLPGYERVYVADPFGNRIELLEAIAQDR